MGTTCCLIGTQGCGGSPWNSQVQKTNKKNIAMRVPPIADYSWMVYHGRSHENGWFGTPPFMESPDFFPTVHVQKLQIARCWSILLERIQIWGSLQGWNRQPNRDGDGCYDQVHRFLVIIRLPISWPWIWCESPVSTTKPKWRNDPEKQ